MLGPIFTWMSCFKKEKNISQGLGESSRTQWLLAYTMYRSRGRLSPKVQLLAPLDGCTHMHVQRVTKACHKRPLKNRQNKGFNGKW